MSEVSKSIANTVTVSQMPHGKMQNRLHINFIDTSLLNSNVDNISVLKSQLSSDKSNLKFKTRPL